MVVSGRGDLAAVGESAAQGVAAFAKDFAFGYSRDAFEAWHWGERGGCEGARCCAGGVEPGAADCGEEPACGVPARWPSRSGP